MQVLHDSQGRLLPLLHGKGQGWQGQGHGAQPLPHSQHQNPHLLQHQLTPQQQQRQQGQQQPFLLLPPQQLNQPGIDATGLQGSPEHGAGQAQISSHAAASAKSGVPAGRSGAQSSSSTADASSSAVTRNASQPWWSPLWLAVTMVLSKAPLSPDSQRGGDSRGDSGGSSNSSGGGRDHGSGYGSGHLNRVKVHGTARQQQDQEQQQHDQQQEQEQRDEQLWWLSIIPGCVMRCLRCLLLS